MSYIPLLPNHEHFVVTLSGPNVYDKNNYTYIDLNSRPVRGIFKAVFSARKIIKENRIHVVHSHSFWTHIISRLATGKKVKLINHYHFADYDTMKNKPSVRRMIWLDKITDRKKLTRVAVSEYVARILKDTFPQGSIKVIPNFIHCGSSHPVKNMAKTSKLKVVAVGNCNLEKNYGLVLEAFNILKDEPITIDVMGGGERLEFYRSEVKRMDLDKVRFCGLVPRVRDILDNYDLFLSASVSETFGIAVLESVCARLPLLISDIPAFHEIAPKTAIFFNPYDKNELANKLKLFLNNPPVINVEDYDRILQKYTNEKYLFELNDLYNN